MKIRRLRRMHHHHLRNPILWIGLIMIPLLLLLLWDGVENLIGSFRPESTATKEPSYFEDSNKPMDILDSLIQEQKKGESSPRVYPYSVVNGGVHSVQELRSAIWRDTVVAGHYSNFELDKARVVEAKADGDFHVSYRIGDEIFWTKKRLKVAKGEKLITDGTHFARTRCANVLSDVIPGRTSPDEPTPQVFDTPTPPPSDPSPLTPPVVIGGPLAPTLPPWAPLAFMPPVVVGGGGGPLTPTLPPSAPTAFILPVNGGGGPSAPPVPVPEPTTMVLLGSGLAGLWGLRKKFRK